MSNYTEQSITTEQAAELRDLGELTEREDGSFTLNVRYTNADYDVEDDMDDSIVSRVEHIAPSSLCEHTDWYENERHELHITFPRKKMSKLPTVNASENFLAALSVAAGFEPLEIGREYPYRRHTGPGSYINDSRICYLSHIQKVAKRLDVRNLPYCKNGQLLRLP